MQKKKFRVIKNTTNPEFTGLEVDGKQMKFKRGGTFVIDAPGLARDIDKTYGRRGNQTVAVVPYNDHETRELGHNYTFSFPNLPALKTTRDNGYVWVKVDSTRQVRMKRERAVAEGYLKPPRKGARR